MNVGYGLGVLNMNELIGHNGDITGGAGTMLRLPAQDATFVVLVDLSTNSANSSGSIANTPGAGQPVGGVGIGQEGQLHAGLVVRVDHR